MSGERLEPVAAVRALRADPPGRASTGRRAKTFGAALEQFEQLLGAALIAPPASAPILLFYALTQAGRAILAAHAPQAWEVHGHGLSVRTERDRIGETAMTPAGDGLFQAVADATGSGPRYRAAYRDWSDDEIRLALYKFLKGRTIWTRSEEFVDAKLSSLRQGISQHGGARRWAAEFGIERSNQRSNGPTKYWTDTRICEKLADFCRGRPTFPSRSEFARAGLGAMLKHGGTAAWARTTGLPRRNAGASRRP